MLSPSFPLLLNSSVAFKFIRLIQRSQDLAEIEKEKGDGDYETIYEQTDGSATPPSTVKNSDLVTRIFACATMWHENKEEMIEFLKSILRLDEDQCARRVAQKYLKVVDPDYYEFESEYPITSFPSEHPSHDVASLFTLPNVP